MFQFGDGGPSAGVDGGPPPLLPSSSSCSSILSPLAPPFTVDRCYAVFPQPMSAAGDWPPASAAASAATSSRLPSLTSGIRSIPSNSVFESASTYYPSYAPVGGGFPVSIDDSLKPLPGLERYGGMDSGPWSGPFLGEEMGKDKGFDRSSSWMDPSSSYWDSAFYKGGAAEGLMTCEDASLVQGNNATSFARNFQFGPESSGWLGGAAEGLMIREDASLVQGNNAASFARNFQFGPESSGWLGDKYPAVYKDNPRAPFDQSGTSPLDPSALFDRLSYSRSQESTSIMKAHDTFNLNSTNNYTAQPASCSTNPMFYNPATACSASTSVYDLSTERTISSMDSVMPANGYLTIQHANPYRINLDYFDYIASEQKEPTVGQISEDGNKEWSIAAGNMKRKFGASVISSPMKNDFPAGHDPLIGNLMECYSEAKCGLRNTRLSLTNSSASASASVEPDNSMQISSDPLDQHSLAVDSPCWKGAPSSRQYPFGIGDKADGCPVVKELKGHNDLDQGQKHLLVSAKYAGTPSSEHVVSSVCRENQKDSSLSYPREPSLVSLRCMHQKFEDAKGECSGCAEVGFENSSQVGHILEEKNNEATKVLNTDSGLKDHALKQLGGEEGVSSAYHNTVVSGMANPEMNVKAAGQDGSSDFSSCSRDHIVKLSSSEVAIPSKTVELLGSSDPSGICPPPGEDPEPIVKAMHGLSEVLFSHYDRKVNELKEHDHELLHQVIDNLKACLVKNGKDVTKETSNVFGIEASPSEVDVQKIGDDLKTSNNKGAKGMKHRMPCSGLDVDNDKVNNVCSVGFDTDCRTRMAQALHKVSKRGFDQEEDPQTLLYKNLWIETEVALCSMKYELARMKLEMENDKCHQRANSYDSSDMERKLSQLTRLRSLNSVNYVNGNDEPRYKAEENLCNTSTQQAYGGKHGTMKPHEVKTNWADELDASVWPRFQALKSCSYNVKFSSVDKHPKFLNSTNVGGCVGTKDAVCSPHLDIENAAGLNYLPAKLADLEFSQRNEQSCTPDEPSSYLKPHEVNTNKTDEVDSSVVARLRVLQGRGDISNSLSAEEYPEKLDSVDPGGCLETKETVGSINLDSENTAGVKNLPAKFADLAFFQQNQQSYNPDEPISCWKPREVRTNRTDEVDSSVMARLSILRGRIDNVNSDNLGEHPKLLDSVDVEGCLGRKDAMCNSSGENNAREKSESFMPTKLADLSFMQKNEQLYAEDEPSKRSCLLNSSSNIQHLCANSNDENELYLNNNSESMARESPVCRANDLVMPDQQWKQNVTEGSGSPSSEWEHVLKDELTWCSSA
ncbi:uncharacterized protein LOC103720380 isoform X2 [Phoenix dactylifera]|uniref:Uncharacterized protein LOC103720380 isoform X2 n=1 Tax=Phoenix dactylifera TaxID=42345 RepID=A0A8B7CX58_PHODC|nr:uncharacterized protein LOC103720380 isoform X2 [Phoenix dactylifera]